MQIKKQTSLNKFVKNNNTNKFIKNNTDSP